MTLDSVDLEKSDRQSVRLRPGWSWEIWCAKRHMVLLARVRDLISTPNCSQKNSTGAITSCLKLASNWVTPPSGPRCCSLDDPQVVGFVLCHVQGEMHFSTVYLLQVCMYISVCKYIWLTFNVQSSRTRDHSLPFPHQQTEGRFKPKMSQAKTNLHRLLSAPQGRHSSACRGPGPGQQHHYHPQSQCPRLAMTVSLFPQG